MCVTNQSYMSSAICHAKLIPFLIEPHSSQCFSRVNWGFPSAVVSTRNSARLPSIIACGLLGSSRRRPCWQWEDHLEMGQLPATFEYRIVKKNMEPQNGHDQQENNLPNPSNPHVSHLKIYNLARVDREPRDSWQYGRMYWNVMKYNGA